MLRTSHVPIEFGTSGGRRWRCDFTEELPMRLQEFENPRYKKCIEYNNGWRSGQHVYFIESTNSFKMEPSHWWVTITLNFFESIILEHTIFASRQVWSYWQWHSQLHILSAKFVNTQLETTRCGLGDIRFIGNPSSKREEFKTRLLRSFQGMFQKTCVFQKPALPRSLEKS